MDENLNDVDDFMCVPRQMVEPLGYELAEIQDNFDDIQNAHIHSIYLINTDKGFAKELDPEGYLQLTKEILLKSEIDI